MAKTIPKLILCAAIAVLFPVAPEVRGQKPSKPDVSSHLSFAGFRLEMSTLVDIQNKMGAVKIGSCSHDVEPITYIGYISEGRDKTKVLFESNRFDPPYELSGIRVVAGNRSTSPCQVQFKASAGVGINVHTDGGLKLGLTKSDLVLLLGAPNEEKGNKLIFEWVSKRPMAKAEIDAETRTFKAPVTDPYWDVQDTIGVVLKDSRVVEFEVQQTIID